MDKIKKLILENNNKNHLLFNDKLHIYSIFDNDENKIIELESVTTKISKYFPFDAKKVSREVAMRNWTTEEEIFENWDVLRQNGSYVHYLVDKYCNNVKLDLKELELIQNVIQFFKDHKQYEIIASEVRIFSKKYNVAGTIDLILRDKETNRLYLLDWKTSAKEIDKNQIFQMAKPPFKELPNNKYYSYSMQLSCYSLILKEEYGVEIWDSFFVHLRYDGTYKLVEPMNLICEAEELFRV